MTDIQIIDPTKHDGWDELLLTNPDTSFFHTRGWCQVLTESYGYKPLYFTRIEDGKLTGLIAVMEINSWLTGKRGVSLPFSDQVEPIAENQENFDSLLKKIISYGQKFGWKSIEIRGGSQFLGNQIPADTFKTHVLNIGDSHRSILKSFRDSTRRNIKKAEKKGLVAKTSRKREDLTSFYHLNCLTRKEHGLPPQPSFFFMQLFQHVIAKDNGQVVLVNNDSGNCIASSVFASFNKKSIFKYGASDKRFHHLRPNNLVLWESIKLYTQNGSRSYDFGRTDLDHKGLLQFKRGWGTEEGVIHYYNFDLKSQEFVTKYPKIKSSYAIFKKMPIPLLKLIGRVLYRHIG